MALIGIDLKNRSLHSYRRDNHMAVWLKGLTLAVFYRIAREYVNTVKGDAHQRLQHLNDMGVSYNGNSPSLMTPALGAGCVPPVDGKHPSRYHTAGEQGATHGEASELPDWQPSVPSGGVSRQTRSGDVCHRKRDQSRLWKTTERKRPLLQQAVVSDMDLPHPVPTRNDGSETLAGTNAEPIKKLWECQGSKAKNHPTYALPLGGVAQETFSEVSTQHAEPKPTLRGCRLSAAVRRLQHPIGSIRSGVMQHAIGQGGGVSSLHQRAAILQRQSLTSARLLPLLAGHPELSRQTLQPAGRGQLEMYRNNQVEWLSGLPNIGTY